MNIIIKTKNIQLTGELEGYIHEKIGKLDKFLSAPGQELFLEIEKETNHHKNGDIFMVKIIIDIPGKKLMTTSHGEDLMKLIIEAKDQMEIEIKKYKTKKIDVPRREAKKSREEIF